MQSRYLGMYVPINGLVPLGKKIRLGISYDGQSSLLAKILKILRESNVIFSNEMAKLIPVDGDDIFFSNKVQDRWKKVKIEEISSTNCI